ncbi:glycosyltransferase [Ectothiorhodospira shaposhnikovii]|uniref:glycosyltransferase n=1 Tax=Ectothiorhodospira shaposhnikovii TaxID=1054 RepID=UPI0039A08C1B
MPKAAPQVSLVIPAWNEAELLGRTLDNLRQACDGLPESYEIIVVDNDSDDDTPDIARAAGAVVVHEPVRRIARARNAGAKVARGHWLIFVDADTWPSRALLRASLDALASGEVCAGGARLEFDHLEYGFYRLGSRFWNWLSLRLGLVAGCYVFCTREAFQAVGGFSEKVYAGEEVFLSRRLKRWGRRRGQRFRVLPEPTVRTSGRKAQWFSPWQHFLVTATVLLVPFALRSRRLTWFWYRRPTQKP